MKQIPSCVDLDKVKSLATISPTDDKLTEFAHYFSLLGDENRLKILLALEKEECCVHELSLHTNLSISALSHQLRKLKDGGLVQSRKDGSIRYYRLSNTILHQLLLCIPSPLNVVTS